MSQGLERQSSGLRQSNAALAAQNAAYERDIDVMRSGAGAEEEARRNGYAKSDEKVYLVSRPQPAAASPKPVVKDVSNPNPMDQFRRWLANLWHR